MGETLDALTLEFVRGEGSQAGGDQNRFVPGFRVLTESGRTVTTVWIRLTRTASLLVKARLADQSTADEVLQQALVRYGVVRLGRELGDPLARTALLAQETVSWVLDSGPQEEGVDELLGLVGDKACEYQQRDGRDLLCRAAGEKDETLIGAVGRLYVAPTSRQLCAGCELPDSRVLCSQLSHPEVYAVTGDGIVMRRDLGGAMCNLGREEIRQPGNCKAGGHACWQQVVDLQADAPAVGMGPLALAEVLDSLNAWWRVAISEQPLLRLTGAATITGLSLPCTTRADFTHRLSDLATALGSIRVEDADLPVDVAPPPPDQSLNRLEPCLKGRCAPDGVERVEDAIQRLRRLQRVRSALQHAGRHDDLVRDLAVLGIAWPPADWAAAWERIRSEAVDALGVLRDEVRDLAEATA
jgi:hypothetical protein